jgi:hypothetical protein
MLVMPALPAPLDKINTAQEVFIFDENKGP